MKAFQKKILILGGTAQQIKIVTAAREQGLYTIVADYLPHSPAKAYADMACDIDALDVDALVELGRKENISGVVSGYIDPIQRPYYEVCRRLELPCYGTAEQFYKLTDKTAFKRLCMENGVDIIPEFTEDDIAGRRVEFPVFVKPADSRGSRGQSVCNTYDELKTAVQKAREESGSGKVLIEKFMQDVHEFQISYFFINGKGYRIRATDSYTGSRENGLERVVACAVSPSRYTEMYIKTAEPKVLKMFRALDIQNGPVFMQGFIDGDRFRFFDPGRRFPGVDYEQTYKKVFGWDLAALMVKFAVTGRMPDAELPEDGVFLKGKKSAILFPTVREGVAGDLSGLTAVSRFPSVISCIPRVSEGERISQSFDINQRLAEIDVLAEDMNGLCSQLESIQDTLQTKDREGRDMMFERFDTRRLTNGIDHHMSVRILSMEDLMQAGCFDVGMAIKTVEQAFVEYKNGNVLFPDKTSVIFDQETQNRINCLPAALLSQQVYGMKWVSVFPENPHVRNLPNLTAVILLSELRSGFPVAFMEGSLCSNLRTAAVGAVAGKYLARQDCESIGFVGAGEQAKSHFLAFMEIRPGIRECRVSSRTRETEAVFIEQMRRFHPEVRFVACGGDYEAACSGADILVSAISGQEKILQPEWVKEGSFYCHVGGLEDDYGVAEKADKIVCDSWRVVKHRTQTISRMFQQGLLRDEDIYADLEDIVTGQIPGRENDREFIYFNSVGMSFADVALATWMYRKCLAQGVGTEISLKRRSMFDGSN